MSVSEDWVQLGKNKLGKTVYYRTQELYEMEWGEYKINLSDMIIAAAPFGGPIALTRNPRKHTRISGPDGGKPYIYIFTASGRLLSKILWNKKKPLLSMNWNEEENLIVLTKSGHVYVYDILGKPLKPFSFPHEKTKDGIISAKIFSSGVAIVTKNLDVLVSNGFDEPKIDQLSSIKKNISEDISLEVIAPELSPNSTCDVLLAHKNITVTNITSCVNTGSDHGPFKKICASPSGAAIATFTESGGLWVVRSDFQENRSEFNTKSKAPPYQLCWCGEDSVCLYWSPEQLGRNTSLLLLIGPNGDFEKFIYESPIHLVNEVDGVRIITNDTHEFLQRVPNSTLDIFRISSLEPAAILFDAFCEFEKKNASSIKNIHQIRDQLPKAVHMCLQAACNEIDYSLQRKLLRAASYGKSFCSKFNHNEFMKTCKKIRVSNAVRDPEIGIPITSKQYDRLTQQTLIDRLVQRYQHLLAFRICEYLELQPETILVHWACAKVRSNESDDKILESIKSKLSKCESASYALVASTAYRVGKKELAVDLLQFEKNAGEQVPLLLDMKRKKLALKKAIQSGETDLVYLVILHLKKKYTPQVIFSIINETQFSIARNLLITYCKEQDRNFLKTFYEALELPHEAAFMMVQNSFIAKDFGTRRKILAKAKDLFMKTRDHYIDGKLCEDQVKLLKKQIELDQKRGTEEKVFIGTSVSDTIYKLFLIGDQKTAYGLKSELKVPDKRFWWIKIRALAQTKNWTSLEKFSKKKSPIGYVPFVQVCLEYDKSGVQAAKYVPKVYNTNDKVELFVQLQKFKEAIQVAYTERNIEMLYFISSKSTNQQTKNTCLQAIEKLGG